MPFLKSFSINTKKQNPFPFNIAAVKWAKQISFHPKLTIFIGDNGCGKSTLLETIALNLNLPLIGGYINAHDGFDAATLLQSYTKIEWKRQTHTGFFFRAEDFSDFINSVENEQRKIGEDLRELKGVVDDSIIKEMSDNMNYSLNRMRKDYGENMQAFSHGEAYLKILQTRIGNKGIFLLDEPEAALSPLKQLSLIFLITEIVKNKNTQFIISTHSPILMGIPDAWIYEIKEDSMERVNYKETEHYRITTTFLNDPDYYLRHL
ncbi:MAG: AAA family ATPase [Ginsengibacter sp.]